MSENNWPMVPLPGPVQLTNNDKEKMFRAAFGVLVVYSAGLAINSITAPGTAESIGVFGFVLLSLYKMSRNIDRFIVNNTGGAIATYVDETAGNFSKSSDNFSKSSDNVLDLDKKLPDDFSKLDEKISGLVSKNYADEKKFSEQIVSFFSKLSEFFFDDKGQSDSTLLTKTISKILEDKSLNDLKTFFSNIGTSSEITGIINKIRSNDVSIMKNLHEIMTFNKSFVVGGKKGKRSLSKKRKSSMKKRKGGKRSGKNQK